MLEETQGTTTITTAKDPRKIAILGNAGTSVGDAPYDDKSWKIWDMSANFQYKRRYDLWFEIHTVDVLEAYATPEYAKMYFDFLNGSGAALIAGHPSPHWPDAQMYPLAEVMRHFGDDRRIEDYFTCTFAYMMAFAILQHDKEKAVDGPGIAEIGLWGVDMAVDEEYSHQKPCAEYWIGIARGRGIKVYVAPESPICRVNAPYGFDNLKLSREFTDRLIEIKKVIAHEERKHAEKLGEARLHETNLIELRACERMLRQITHKWAL